MIILSVATTFLSISVLYLVYSYRKVTEDLISTIEFSLEKNSEHINIVTKSIKEDNAWQVAAIKRYLGDELGKLHEPGNDATSPRPPSIHRKREYKAKRKGFTPEQKLAASLKAKEMWAKRKESKHQPGDV